MANAGEMTQLLECLGAADGDRRRNGEKMYEEALKSQPDGVLTGLLMALKSSDQVPHRELAAVLLRRQVLNADGKDSLWHRLQESTRASVCSGLLELLKFEQNAKIRRKIADCIQSLGNEIITLLSDQRPSNCEAWPQLMPTLLGIVCDTSQAAGLRADCIWAMKELAVSVWQVLVANIDQTVQVVRGCLSDSNFSVKAEAVSLMCSLADNIEKRSERKPLHPLIPEMMNSIVALAKSEDPKPLDNVLQNMQCSTEVADFLKDSIGSHFLPVIAEIAKGHGDEDCKKSALEVLLTYMDSKPKFVFTKVPEYIPKVIEICIDFITTLDEDVDAWASRDDDDDADDEVEVLHKLGRDGIDRICRCASQPQVDCFGAVQEVLKQAMAAMFASGGWKQVIGGMDIMFMMVEFVDDEAMVDQMLQGILPQLSASHPRVRGCAWSLIAQFATDHEEIVANETWSARILPHYLTGMDDSCPRVVVRCMVSFQYLGECLEREDLEPLVQPLMEKVGAKIQAGPYQSKAIPFIAVIARQVEDSFTPYYSTLMPLMKEVVRATLHNVEDRQLLGRCFECISLMGKAVGRQAFKADGEHILDAMVKASQVPNLPANDPVQEYTMSAAERICMTLKEDFLPFVPRLLPGILAKFNASPKDLSSLEDGEIGKDLEIGMLQEGGEQKYVLMRSSELQDLQGALECVQTFVEQLEGSFSPFVQQTAMALLPVFDFPLGEDIREMAHRLWGALCQCAGKANKGDVVGALVMEFLQRVLPKIEDEKAKAEPFIAKTGIDGITTCLKKAGPNILSVDQAKHLCQTVLKLTMESLKRRAAEASERASLKAAKREGVVPDDDDDLDDDWDNEEQSLRVALQEVAGAVMEHHPQIFVAQAMGDFVQLVQQLAQSGSSEDKKLALFYICDFVDNLGSEGSQHYQQFVPALLEEVHNQDPEIRQPACYGVSRAAKQPAFAPLAAQAAERVARVVTETRGRGKKKKTSEKLAQACADNALSAVINILLHQDIGDAAAKAQLWNVWLSGLPCQVDEEEAAYNHGVLLKLICEEKAEVVGENGSNVPRWLALLVDHYQGELTSDETDTGIGQLVVRLGQARLEQMASSFSDKQKKKLMRIFREASK
eukprot:CAMPEP_0206433370 /NCGR_PEP_ID=MMETSP0324_2-20121206/8490_1 /ASSEMBLY_ACC=CAM_ASM_000836 /TAXON_ID=2866 /ORGANISM="Crypthecodinium cohnii, Strain Seligo" /LENGTH=1119 /DNA_ID=CAMNT_0053899617 /DNA_START=37 /DNA_END=3396 /DNA_ORIENTATION=-